MESEKRDNIISLISYKHSLLCKAIACLLIFTFTITNTAYGYDRGDFEHLREIRVRETKGGRAGVDREIRSSAEESVSHRLTGAPSEPTEAAGITDEISRNVGLIHIDDHITDYKAIELEIERLLRRFINPDSKDGKRILSELNNLNIVTNERYFKHRIYFWYGFSIILFMISAASMIVYRLTANGLSVPMGCLMLIGMVSGALLGLFCFALGAKKTQDYKEWWVAWYHGYNRRGRAIISVPEKWRHREVIHEFAHFIIEALGLEDRLKCFGEAIEQLAYGDGRAGYLKQCQERWKSDIDLLVGYHDISRARRFIIDKSLKGRERSKNDDYEAGAYIAAIAKTLFPDDNKKAFAFLISLFREETNLPEGETPRPKSLGMNIGAALLWAGLVYGAFGYFVLPLILACIYYLGQPLLFFGKERGLIPELRDRPPTSHWWRLAERDEHGNIIAVNPLVKNLPSWAQRWLILKHETIVHNAVRKAFPTFSRIRFIEELLAHMVELIFILDVILKNLILVEIPFESLTAAEVAGKDTFLEDFHKKQLFISTDELGLEEGERITIKEMLERFAVKRPRRLEDPDSVLVILSERDRRFIYKQKFDNMNARPGDFYWVVYAYPVFRTEAQFPVPQDIFMSLGMLTPQEEHSLTEQLEYLGHELYFKERDNLEGLNAFIDDWLEKNRGGLSNLELAKKLLLYFHKSFDGFPYSFRRSSCNIVEAIMAVLRRLAEDKKVTSWMAQLVKVAYVSGEHLKTRFIALGSECIAEFEILLSVLIEKERKDIFSIAIHSLIERRYSGGRDEDKKNPFIVAMRASRPLDIKKAVFFKALESERSKELIVWRKGEDKYKDIVKDIVFLIRYLLYIGPFDKNSYLNLDHPNSLDALVRLNGTCDRLTSGSLCREVVSALLDALQREENHIIREKLFLFLNSTSGSDIIGHSEDLSHKWIDIFIYLVSKHRLHIISSYRTIEIMEKHPDYRRQELEEVLLKLLDDVERDDISQILSMLRACKSSRAQETLIKHYLRKDSPYYKDALFYMIMIKDPSYFDKVWSFILDLESERQFEAEEIFLIGWYCAELLQLEDEKRLDKRERSEIMDFVKRNILSKDFKDFINWTKKSSPPHCNYLWPVHGKRWLGSKWIILAGLLGREDKLGQLKEIAEQPVGTQEWTEELLQSLSLFSSEESYAILSRFSASLLDAEGLQNEKLCDFLEEPVTNADKAQKRRLFIELIDTSITNQLRDWFASLVEYFIYSDPEGALGVLKSGKWSDVDLSCVTLSKEVRDEDKDEDETVFMPKNFLDYFMEWYFKRFGDLGGIQRLQLIDDKDKFLGRVRLRIRTILMDQLGLKEDEIRAKFQEFVITPFFRLLMWSGSLEEDEQLSALYLLKPIKDLVDLNLDIQEGTPRANYLIWERLNAHDPVFYTPLQKEILAYLGWLRQKEILKGRSYLTFDRFALYFIERPTPDRDSFKIRGHRVAGINKFLRNRMLPFFYPEGLKEENPRGFIETFLRCLGALWAKDAWRRTQEGSAVQILLPMFEDPCSGPKPGFGHSGNGADWKFIDARRLINEGDFAGAKRLVLEAIYLLGKKDLDGYPEYSLNQTEVAIWVLRQLAENGFGDEQTNALLEELGSKEGAVYGITPSTKREGKLHDRTGFGFVSGRSTKRESEYKDLLYAHLRNKGFTSEEMEALTNALARIKKGALNLREIFFTEQDVDNILGCHIFNVEDFIKLIKREKERYERKRYRGRRLFTSEQIYKLLFKKLIPLSWIEELMADDLSKRYVIYLVLAWSNPKKIWKKTMKPIRDELIQSGLSKVEATRIVLGWSNPKKTWEKTMKPIRDELIQGGLSKTDATCFILTWSNPKAKFVAINATVPRLAEISGMTEAEARAYLIDHAYTNAVALLEGMNVARDVIVDVLAALKSYEDQFGKATDPGPRPRFGHSGNEADTETPSPTSPKSLGMTILAGLTWAGLALCFGIGGWVLPFALVLWQPVVFLGSAAYVNIASFFGREKGLIDEFKDIPKIPGWMFWRLATRDKDGNIAGVNEFILRNFLSPWLQRWFVYEHETTVHNILEKPLFFLFYIPILGPFIAELLIHMLEPGVVAVLFFLESIGLARTGKLSYGAEIEEALDLIKEVDPDSYEYLMKKKIRMVYWRRDTKNPFTRCILKLMGSRIDGFILFNKIYILEAEWRSKQEKIKEIAATIIHELYHLRDEKYLIFEYVCIGYFICAIMGAILNLVFPSLKEYNFLYFVVLSLLMGFWFYYRHDWQYRADYATSIFLDNAEDFLRIEDVDAPAIALVLKNDQWVWYEQMDEQKHQVINDVWKEFWETWEREHELPEDDEIYQDVERAIREFRNGRSIHIHRPSDDKFYDRLYELAERRDVNFPDRNQFRLITHPGTGRYTVKNSDPHDKDLTIVRSFNMLIPESELNKLRAMRKSNPSTYQQWLNHETSHLKDRAGKRRGQEAPEKKIIAEHGIDAFVEACNAEAPLAPAAPSGLPLKRSKRTKGLKITTLLRYLHILDTDSCYRLKWPTIPTAKHILELSSAVKEYLTGSEFWLIQDKDGIWYIKNGGYFLLQYPDGYICGVSMGRNTPVEEDRFRRHRVSYKKVCENTPIIHVHNHHSGEGPSERDMASSGEINGYYYVFTLEKGLIRYDSTGVRSHISFAQFPEEVRRIRFDGIRTNSPLVIPGHIAPMPGDGLEEAARDEAGRTVSRAL